MNEALEKKLRNINTRIFEMEKEFPEDTYIRGLLYDARSKIHRALEVIKQKEEKKIT